MKKPLTDKRNFIGCNPVLLGNEIMSLIATVDEFKEENAKLKEQLDINTPREALIQLQEENEKLKKENDELKFTINFAQSANWEFKEENEKLKTENSALRDMVQSLMAKVDSEKQDRIWAEDAEKELIKENEELTEELIRGCAFTEDFEKLKAENENLAYTIRLLRSSP